MANNGPAFSIIWPLFWTIHNSMSPGFLNMVSPNPRFTASARLDQHDQRKPSSQAWARRMVGFGCTFSNL